MCPKPFTGEGDPGLAQTVRQSRVIERASDSPPQLERALRPLVFLVFSLLPEGFHLLEGGVFGLPDPDLTLNVKTRLDDLELVEEIGNIRAKYILRVELDMAGEVRDRGEEIAKFLRTLGGLS